MPQRLSHLLRFPFLYHLQQTESIYIDSVQGFDLKRW
jgi:hypothetical protein